MALPVGDLAELFAAIVDIASVSGDERQLADAVEDTLRGAAHLGVIRDGDTIIARTDLGRPSRVVIAGHLDTVPIADNLPSHWETGANGAELYGRGTTDMKGGIAVMLRAALALTNPVSDITWVFYDQEEVSYERNGLGRVMARYPDLIRGDFA
ncbi:MAG: M20/M25/M40 family metallo-hydrolase, partial [Propionibacteriaceae bacterium]|nr:M20/M25/M40 family metallo-hydrolase [Propionibacteriaceae bacterium]